MQERFSRLSRVWLVATATVLAIALTWTVIRVSEERGRLATYPRVDDVIYMSRGAELARAARGGYGAGGALGMTREAARDWRRDPPHSPWASGCAAVGYVCFGYQDWAAYVATGVPVLVFLLFAARLSRRAGGGWQWRAHALVVFAATAPFLAASVYNLKPDYCAGILAAVGMMTALRLPVLKAPWGRLVRIGACFGLALLAKPAMMVPTSLLCVGTLGTCAVRDVLVAGRMERAVWRGVRAGVLVVGTAALISLPHYAVGGRHAWAYSANLLAGEKTDAWAMHGSWGQHALYYLTGPGGHLMLDGLRSLATAGGVFVLYGVVAMARTRNLRRRRVVYWLACVAVLGMAYLGPTFVAVKIAQFASGFSALLWLLAVDSAAGLLGRTRVGSGRSGPLWTSILAMAVLGASVAAYRFTMPLRPSDRSNPARVRQRERGELVERLYRDIQREAIAIRARRAGPVRVMVAGSPNELRSELIQLWGVRDGLGLAARELRRVPASSDRSAAIGRELIGDADIVVVGEPGSALTRPKHESGGSDLFYLRLAREHRELELAASQSEPSSGKVFEVYRHRERR